MTILGNKNIFIEDDIDEKQAYTVPAVIRNNEEMSLKKSVFLSAFLHPTVVGLVWLIIVVLALMGITFSIFERPKPKVNDIEFVLVDKQATPKNKNTRNRSDMNSRTGGKNDPKKKVSMPSPSPTKKSIQQKAVKSQPAKKQLQKQPKENKPKPKQDFFKQFAPKHTEAQPQKPQPPSARPSLKPPAMPKLSNRPNPQFALPVPKPTGATSGKSYSTGPIGGHGTAKSSSGPSGGRYAPTPSLSPTYGGSSGSSGSRMSRGSSGSGNAGNPGGGGGAPGIDSIREPDFGPYMRELQRRIKMNWDPPKGNESKRVVLLFKIARDGRLLSVRVFKSSGIPNSDRAALSAVELTAPFKPLPPDFKGGSIDIQFTFDYNVFGASGYN